MKRQPPHREKVWGSLRDIPANSGIGLQIQHMRDVVSGTENGAEFARGWLAGRRLALSSDERVRPPFERILDDLFFILEDSYSIDPEFRDDSDLTESELVAHVAECLNRLESL